MKFLSGTALVFLVLAFTDAAPISTPRKKCSEKCDVSRNLLNYKVGKKYVYDFKNIIVSDLPKGTTERAQIELTAKAAFHIIGKCEVVLKLKSVSMKETLLKGGAAKESGSLTELPKQLEGNDLPFGFNAGRVTNLCPKPEEERIPLNIKRAIISQFQISMEHLETPTSLTERDVSGDCLTQYRYGGRRDENIRIEKTKAILGCANRTRTYSDLQGQNFDRPTETSQMPLLKGSSTCRLEVSQSKRHLVSSICEEKQVFRPFSGKMSGATISVEQSLTLKDVSKCSTTKPQLFEESMTNLLLEHSPAGYRDFRSEKDTQTAEDVLKQICSDVKKNALGTSKIIAQSFPKFVRYLRDLDVKGLKDLQGKIGISICKKVKKIAKGVFQDAVPMIRTSQAIAFMLDELSSGKSTDYRRSWLFSLATVREPTMEMIKKLNEIGGKLNNPLIASSMVATYCKTNELCDEEEAVKNIVKRITADLGTDCSGNKDKVSLALRAIGNLGMASDWKVLSKCIRNTKISMSVRVSAVQAMRKVRCDSDSWDLVDLMGIFKSSDEDSELRINAYLSLITCSARSGVLDAIVAQLDKENCQQIGSFVWTHLSNIVETSQVFRQALRESLQKIKFYPGKYAKKFNLDYRKFSRNYEKSYFYEPLNSGLAGEVNVIFSTDSFVPRAVSMNLTAGLFGKSISLVEFGARGNNVDQLFRAAYQSTAEKRGDGSKMIHFSIDKFKQKTFGKTLGTPSADLYLRMFGNELAYVSDLNLGAVFSRPGAVQQMARLGQALNDMKFENTRMMMEAVVSVPTVSGFPIELSLDLASSIRMSGGVQMGSENGKKSLTVNYDPSGAVGLVGRMRLDAQDTEIGIEFHGTLFRNFKMGGKLSFDSNEVTLLMDAPQEKATLVDLSSQMFLIHQRSQRLQEMKAKRNKFNLCNTKRSQTIFGLQLCLDANYANNSQVAEGPSFPFTGSNQVTVTITPLAKVAKFKVRGALVRSSNSLSGIQSMEMEMNALGTKEDRQLLFAFNDKTKGANVDISLKMFSPIKKMEITAKGDLSKGEMDASLKVDKKTLLQLNTKQKMEGTRSVTTIFLGLKKNKLIEATYSSDTTLKMDESDHLFEFKSQKFFITFLKVTATKKFLDDFSTSSKYSFDIKGKQRSANGNLEFTLKEKSSDGKMNVIIKKGSKTQFGWKNDFSVKTVKDKSINKGANMVTQHVIKFSNNFDNKNLAMFNVKNGVLMIQHDFNPDIPEAKRFLYIKLKTAKLDHTTTFQLSQTTTPFAIVFDTNLRLNYQKMKLALKNKLNVAVSGWKAVRIENSFKMGDRKYAIFIENTINPKKVVQEVKVDIKNKSYHLKSSFVADGETIYQHTARVAWYPKKSYQLKSTIDWGTPLELQSCRFYYQINSTALQNGRRLGNFFMNLCPNLRDRALALEAQLSDKSRMIGLFRGDTVFKTKPRDFHIGLSAETNIPGIIKFDFRTNHIYAEKRKSSKAEVTSEVMATFKGKKFKDGRTYGYRLSGTGTEQGSDGKLTVEYYYSPIGQIKSTYQAGVTIKKWTRTAAEVETKLKVSSALIGDASLTVTTDVVNKGGSITVKTQNVFKGRLSLISENKFNGKQNLKFNYLPGDQLTAESKLKLQIEDLDAKKSWPYKYRYQVNVNNLKNPLELGVKFDFSSNFALRKLSFKNKPTFKPKKDGSFTYDSTVITKWTYAGKDGKFSWMVQADFKPNQGLTASSQMKSTNEKLKDLLFTVNYKTIPNKSILKIGGKYNDRQAELTLGSQLADKPASKLGDDPDYNCFIFLKGDIPYLRDAKLSINAFYQEFKFIQFDTTIVHFEPQTTTKIFFNSGYSKADMVAKVELGATTPFGTPELKMKVGVQGRADSKMDPVGPISERLLMISNAEASLMYGKKTDIKFIVNQKTIKKETQFIAESVIKIGDKHYIPLGTKLVLSFEKTGLGANKGRLFFVKNSNAPFESFEQSFDYDFVKAVDFDTKTVYQSKDLFSVKIRWSMAPGGKKSMELYLKPSGGKDGFKLEYKVSFMPRDLSFDSTLSLRFPKLIEKIDMKVSLFQSLQGKTKNTDLLKKAVKSFSFSLSTSKKALAEFQLKAAMSKDMKGQLVLNVVSKKNLNLKIAVDLSNLAKITGSIEINDKKIEISLEQKGSKTKLIVKGDGKKIGEANMNYKAGKSLKASLNAMSPSGKKLILEIKHKHPKGDWDWRDWTHDSSAKIKQGGKTLFTASQKLSFNFKKAMKEGRMTADFETSVAAFKSFKTTGLVNWSDGLQTKLDVDFKGDGNSQFTIKHSVQNWKTFFASALNKIAFSSATSNFGLILNSECNPNPSITFEVTGNAIPYFSLFHISINKKYVIKFDSETAMGKIKLESNVLGILTGAMEKEVYIRGNILNYGKVTLLFGFLGDKKYKLQLKFGKEFITLYPTLVIKSSPLPFDASINIKIETSFEAMLNSKVEIVQKISEDFLSAEHKTEILTNGSPFVTVAAKYDVMSDDKFVELEIQKAGRTFSGKLSYNPVSSIYTHRILVTRKSLGKRPVFESIADCTPYELTADIGKCYLSGMYARTKVVFEVENKLKGSKITKTLKLAWNDLREKYVKFSYEKNDKKKAAETSLTFQSPIRSYRIQQTQAFPSGSVTDLKFSTLTPDLKRIVGFVNIFMENKPKEGEDYEYTVRIQSSLLKKEIKTVVNYAISEDDKLTITADMYFETPTPSLSMKFTMTGFREKRELELKLTGGDRYLNMFLNYDMTNPVKSLKVGAKAKDWKRELSVLYEPKRMLETVVDTGKNKQTVKFEAEPMAQNNGYRYKLVVDYPEVKGYLGVILQFNRSPLSLLIIVQRDKKNLDNQLVINGRFMNSRNILMEIKRVIGSNQITDAYTQVTLNADKIVRTDLKWRPGVFSDAKNFLLYELAPTKMNEYLKKRGEGLLEVLQRVVKAVAAPIKANINLNTVLDAAQAVVTDFQKVKDGIVTSLNQFDIVFSSLRLSNVLKTITEISDQINTLIGIMIEGYSKTQGMSINPDFTKVYAAVKKQYQMIYKKLKEYTKDWNDAILINFLTTARGVITQAAEGFNVWLNKATQVAKNWAEKRNEFFRTLKERLGRNMSGNYNFFKRMQNWMIKMQESVTGVIVGKLFSQDDLKEWAEITEKLGILNNWLKSYFSGSKRESDLQLSMQYLKNGDLKQAFVTYFKPEKNKILSWKLEQCYFSWQVYFPYDIKSLQSLPAAILSYTQSKVRSTVKEIRQGSFVLGKYYLRLNELVFRYSLKEALRRQLPPFKANAWISGSQHFVTFDGVNVEHSAGCTYLLAHDFAYHSFSVLGEYMKKGKMVMRKNLIVQTNQAAIYISPRGEVKVRSAKGQKLQSKMAPFVTGDLFVSRWGSVLTVKGPNDFSVRCFLDLDVCRLTVSRWSHGHINGFLGSNDYEKCNDVYKANMKNDYPFCLHADIWKVGKCEAKNYAVTHKSYAKNSLAYKSCRILDRAGSFSRCFSKVDPKSYLKSCMNMHQMSKKMGSVCSIFLMYVSKCRAEGVILQMPRNCMTCGKRSRLAWIKYLKPFKIQKKSKKNFVFVVEAKPCVKQITGVFKQLIKTILSRKEADTYNLITFGGDGYFKNPTLHMLGKTKTRGNKNDFVTAMSKVQLNGKSSFNDGKVATKAVQMALTQNDEVSSATVIVLITCSKCQESEKYQYTNMQRRFSKRGIRFHYFLPHDFGSNGKRKVVGFATPKVYFKNGRGEKGVRIQQPRDTCSALARSTRGSSWDINTLVKMNMGATRGSMLKNALKKQHKNLRVCYCTGSLNNDDVLQCKDRK